MVDVLDSLELALAVYKDSVDSESRKNFKASFQKLLKAEADARRAKAAAIIEEMASLKIELMAFQITYRRLKLKTGSIPVIDNYIVSVQQQIQKLSAMKNNHNFM